MELSALAIYRPAWIDAHDRRQRGPDEDVATLAVSAGRLLAEHLGDVNRVVLITRRPDALLGTTAEVVLAGLGLDPQTPVAEEIGGAPATLNALNMGIPGTLIVAVDPNVPAAAGAALIGPGPLAMAAVGTVRHSVPVHTVPLPDAVDLVYDDPRLLRERGWRRAIDDLAVGPVVAVAGLPERDLVKLLPGAIGVSELEAVAPLVAVENVAERQESTRLVAIENGHGVAVDISTSGALPLYSVDRTAHVAPATWEPSVPAEIPASPASYERAFEAKVGLKAAVCVCGAQQYPPRALCESCGESGRQRLQVLPRRASVYSVVTVHAAVPGKRVPYSLAVVDVDDSDLRVLAHITDSPPGDTPIGTPGQLVLRRVAERAGVPDYGYAFQAEEMV